MDEFDNKKLLKKLSFIFNEKRNNHWNNIHYFLTIYETILHINSYLTITWFFNIKKSNQEINKLTQLIKNKFRSQSRLFFFFETCKNNHCIFHFNYLFQVKKIFKKKIFGH
ncbi:hypothetical protein [Blattabacterium cuenoti]|uniref:hypothetical protein n=1 Tax=Blattabacterium cuenoti TaxID=1653831 RepID=UPI00163BD3D1|nr:hypothetical protein [Blattabacterium cuenoti]